MHQAIKDMLMRYQCNTANDYINALKEIMQEIALLGLSRQRFFDKTSFYGGTALRITHGLNRFSEDIDFTLNQPDSNYDIGRYLKGIKEEFTSFGLNLIAEKKIKTAKTSIDSAFLKANTLEHLLLIEGLINPAAGTHRNELIKIKLEVDTQPSSPASNSEIKFLTLPIPFSYRVLTLPSLFAGKLHAILCREYASGRVKGRDYYDFIWYINKKVSPDLNFLKGKLCESKKWESNQTFTLSDLTYLLNNKFETIDWSQAQSDVSSFIKNIAEINIWSTVFFKSLIPRIN